MKTCSSSLATLGLASLIGCQSTNIPVLPYYYLHIVRVESEAHLIASS